MGFISRLKVSSAYFNYEDRVFKPAFLAALASCKAAGAREPFDICEATWANVVSSHVDSPIPIIGDHAIKYCAVLPVNEGANVLEWIIAVFFVPKFYEIQQGQELARCWAGYEQIERRDAGLLFNSIFENENPMNYERLVRHWGARPFDRRFREARPQGAAQVIDAVSAMLAVGST